MNKSGITTILAIAVTVCIVGFACLKLYDQNVNSSARMETQDDLEVWNEKCEYLVDISQEDLNERLENKDSFWVYIGRPSCPDCQRFLPKLEKLLTRQKKKLFYYNTTCKASEKKEMKAYVEGLHVHEIPAILKVEEGNITVLDMQTEDDVKQFEKEF